LKRLYLYDDAQARLFEPFALTRPVSELRAGAEVIRLRWERAAGGKAYAFIGASHLRDFKELDSPRPAGPETTVPAGSVIVNSRFVVSLAARIDDTSAAFAADGVICAVRVRKSTDIARLLDGSMDLKDLVPQDVVPAALPGRWLNEVWDLVGSLPEQLAEDIPLMGGELSGAAVENATVIGRHSIYLETGTGIEPFVVLDASAGPILIRRGATVASFTRIVGPCYIGEDSHVVGDAIRGCSIGNMCKVRGEMSSTVMLGHSNKGHTGFVGNSYLGRWVNIGAGTTTSNLKNTYGIVSLWTPSGVRDTDLQFLGSLIGDHAKLGIGTMLTTGCVVGAGANVFGANVTPKYVPPFAWGEDEPWDRVEFDKFCETAERMMERRQMTLDSASVSLLSEAYRMSREIP
jgi:UDP-N-acetylglucosamine diphosphorylase/glucosamine-1-phosphate N-acetyltransferase